MLWRSNNEDSSVPNFVGKTEEAFRFYERVLGGKLTEFYRFGAMPARDGFELTPEQKNLVMHLGLTLPDGQMIMASDTLPGMGPQHVATACSTRSRRAAPSRCRSPTSSGATTSAA